MCNFAPSRQGARGDTSPVYPDGGSIITIKIKAYEKSETISFNALRTQMLYGQFTVDRYQGRTPRHYTR